MVRAALPLFVAVLLMAGCKKPSDEERTCEGHPHPSVNWISWPSGYPTTAADTVVCDSVYINLGIWAGIGYGDPPRLLGGSVRLASVATDSTLFIENLGANNNQSLYVRTLVLDSIAASIPAYLRVTVTNECGHSVTDQRNYVVMPD